MPIYTNPVLDADWPDPDVIRVGAEYYLVASSFNRVPGLPILTSRDLVHWRFAGHALAALPPAEHYALPRHGSGVWAPSIRHHDEWFVVVYPDPDHGVYVTWATDAAGPWSAPHLLLPGRGIIDPCPLWDDDGRAYVVHGWARSRSGVANRLTVVEVDPRLERVVGEPRTVVDGDELPGCRTLEGPKLYKRDGWYWIFAPAGGVATGWQYAFRSRDVYGPYEHRVVLEQGGTAVNGPHQGAWVEAEDGKHWFCHFQDRGVFGRVVHLQPMTWADDGWPRIGDPIAATPGSGRPVASAEYSAAPPPDGPTLGCSDLACSDRFDTPTPRPVWHWQSNPHGSWLHSTGDGALRLRLLPEDRGDLRTLGQILGQRLPGRSSTWTTTLRLDGGVPGARAGVVVLGREYAWAGLTRTPAGAEVVCRRSAGRGVEEGGAAALVADGVTAEARVELRVEIDDAGTAMFSWRAPGATEWSMLDDTYQAAAGYWIGAEVGLFGVAPFGAPAGPDEVATFGPVTATGPETHRIW